MKTVGIIGIGKVGGLVAYNLLTKGYSVKAYDIMEDYAKGQIMDLKHAFAFVDVEVEFADVGHMRDCDLIIITAGFPRAVQETRADLFGRNKVIIEDILAKLGDYDGLIITVTNPVDAINTLVARAKGREKCFGFGNMLDSARLVCITRGASDFIIGEHGENFVPVISNKNMDRDELVRKVKADNLLVIGGKKGTEYGPAYHIAELADALLSGKEFNTYVSVLCEGEFGVSGISIGVPARIKNGKLDRVMEMHLDQWEEKRFREGVEAVRKLAD